MFKNKILTSSSVVSRDQIEIAIQKKNSDRNPDLDRDPNSDRYRIDSNPKNNGFCLVSGLRD